MPPLTKTCPKMVPSDKGGSLCVKQSNLCAAVQVIGHPVLSSMRRRAQPSTFVLFHGLSPRVSSRFRRSRLIAEGSFRLASKTVALVAVAGREVEGDKSGNARSLCDVTGLTRREMPPLCGNFRIRVKERCLDEELVGTVR